MSETASAVAETTETQTDSGAQASETAAAAGAETSTEKAGESTTTTDDSTKQTTSGPPEQYALTVADEGVITAEGLKAFEIEARALGLTNAQAQAALDRRLDAFFAQSDADLAALQADTTYGGDRLPQTQKYAETALNRFAPKGTPIGDGLRDLLRQSGRGNALPVVAFFAEIGKAMAEDRPVGGGAGQGEKPVEKRLADKLYETVADQVVQA